MAHSDHIVVYSSDDTVSHINNFFDMKISKAELQSCKPELVLKIYSNFMKDFGADLETFKQVPFDNTSTLMQQYPDMFKNILFQTRLAKYVQQILIKVYGHEGFAITDVVAPKVDRTLKFLTLLIKFYGVVVEKKDIVIQIEEEVNAKQDAISNLRQDNESLNVEYKNRQMQQAENKISIDKAMHSLEIEKDEVAKEQELKNRLKGRLEGIKGEIANFKAKIKDTELALLEKRDKIETLKSQVVLEQDLLDHKERSHTEEKQKASNDELKDIIKNMKETEHDLQTKYDFIKEAFDKLAEYETDLKKKEETEVKIKSLQKQLSNLFEVDNELLSQLQMLSENYSILVVKKSHMENTMKIRKDGFDSQYEDLKACSSEKEKIYKEQLNEIKQMKETIVENEEEIRTLNEKAAKFQEACVRTLITLSENLEQYAEKFREGKVKNIDDITGN